MLRERATREVPRQQQLCGECLGTLFEVLRSSSTENFCQWQKSSTVENQMRNLVCECRPFPGFRSCMASSRVHKHCWSTAAPTRNCINTFFNLRKCSDVNAPTGEKCGRVNGITEREFRT
jgi:hypothetical protein